MPDKGKYHENNVSITSTFPDGSVGVVDYLAYGDKSFPKERVVVFCGSKIVILDNFRTLEMVHNGRRKKIKGVQDKGWRDELGCFCGSNSKGEQSADPL